MKICFITDLHIDEDDILPFGVDVRSRLKMILKEILHKDFDLIIVGGDLHNKSGDIEVYKWIKTQLDQTNIDFYVLAGNHDSPQMIAQVFVKTRLSPEGELYYRLSLRNTGDIYFLDTSQGKMSDRQYLWLEQHLNHHGQGDVILCMHHPPILSGSKHMEPTYFFTQSEKFESLCSNYPQKRFIIFTGHYHIARTVLKENITLFITPATSIQIDPDSVDLIKDTVNFGYREIYIENQVVTMTNVVYMYK